MFSIFNCGTHERVSKRSYATAEAANHDYHMDSGRTYVGPVTDPLGEAALKLGDEATWARTRSNMRGINRR